MALTRNFRRTGAAAHNEKREIREEIAYQNKINEEKAMKEENQLIVETLKVYGDEFANWYDSPAVPSHGFARDRIELIKAWIAEQEQKGLHRDAKPVVWRTDEEPPTYRAVWTDEPGITRFEKTTAPTGSKGGEQEAMKKPATEIIP